MKRAKGWLSMAATGEFIAFEKGLFLKKTIVNMIANWIPNENAKRENPITSYCLSVI